MWFTNFICVFMSRQNVAHDWRVKVRLITPPSSLLPPLIISSHWSSPSTLFTTSHVFPIIFQFCGVLVCVLSPWLRLFKLSSCIYFVHVFSSFFLLFFFTILSSFKKFGISWRLFQICRVLFIGLLFVVYCLLFTVWEAEYALWPL